MIIKARNSFFFTIFLSLFLYNKKGDAMVIYVDLIFILNIFLDFTLLMSVSVILTRNTKIKRLILGSIVGGLSTVILFISINSLFSFVLKILLGLLMTLVSFGYQSLKYTLNNLFYLYTLSFSVGGVMYLLMDKGYYNYLLLIVGFIIVLFIYVYQLKRYQTNYANYYNVELYVANKKYILTGFLDTGNKLYDSVHRPVIILNKRIKYNPEEVIYVPYATLNSNSVLKCLKTDKIIINNHVFNNYLVGLSNKKINIDGINCILHSKMKGMI